MGHSAGPQIGLAGHIFSSRISHLFCLIPNTTFLHLTEQQRSAVVPPHPSPPKISSRAGGEKHGAGAWTRELMVRGKKLTDGPSLHRELLGFLFNLFSLIPRKPFLSKMQ